MIFELISITIKSKLKNYFTHFSNYFIGMTSTIITQIVHLMIITFIFANFKSNNIYGWTKQEVVLLFVYGTACVNFINFISAGYFNVYNQYIISGVFDTVILRPVKPYVTIIIENLEISRLFVAVVDILLVIMIIFFYEGGYNLNIFQILFLIFNIILCGFTFLFQFSIISSFSFIIKTKTNLITPLLYTTILACYPMNMFPKSAQFVFTYIIPLKYISNIPLIILKGELPWYNYLFLFMITIIYYIIARYVWNIFMRKYYSCGI